MKLARIMLPLPIEEPNSELLLPEEVVRMLLNYEFDSEELQGFSPITEGTVDWDYTFASPISPYSGIGRFLSHFSMLPDTITSRRPHPHEVVDLVNCPQCDTPVDDSTYVYVLPDDTIYFCNNCEEAGDSLINAIGRIPYVTPTGRRRIFSLRRTTPLGQRYVTPNTNLFMNVRRGAEANQDTSVTFANDVRILTNPRAFIPRGTRRDTSYWFGDAMGIRPFTLVRLLLVTRDYASWAIPYPAELSGILSYYEPDIARWGDVVGSLLEADTPLAAEYSQWLTSTYETAQGVISNEA